MGSHTQAMPLGLIKNYVITEKGFWLRVLADFYLDGGMTQTMWMIYIKMFEVTMYGK